MVLNNENNGLRLIAHGDHSAFRSLFIKYFPKIKYFISHLIKSEAIADELTQDIFLKVWENKDTLPDIRSINAYLYRMAKHSAINYLEHKYIEEAYRVEYTQPESTRPEEELEAKELEFLIRLTVDRMPEQRRKIYVMSRVEYIKNSEIAKTLDISEKTVNNQLSLALNEIRRMLQFALVFLFVFSES